MLKGKCEEAREIKERIVSFMTVPLIQGSLRYAYKLPNNMEPDEEKGQAEGNVFTQAVLPLIHKCSPPDAKIIYDNMRIGNPKNPDYEAVKAAYERTYDCLNITCDMVGGLAQPVTPHLYYEGAEPCIGTMSEGSSTNGGDSTSSAFSSLPMSIVRIVTTMAFATMTMNW